jgi:hypothetical protein
MNSGAQHEKAGRLLCGCAPHKVFFPSLRAAVRDLVFMKSGRAILVADLDRAGNFSAALDALNRLRRRKPQYPVILLSSAFAEDDFSLSRLAISDISLKLPISCKLSLEQVLKAALSNNDAWQDRQKYLRPSRFASRRNRS